MTLPAGFLLVKIPSVIIDGQKYKLMAAQGATLEAADKGYLKLQNISDLNNLNFSGFKSKIELENVVLTGDFYPFSNAEVHLTSIRTQRVITKDSKRTTSISISSTNRGYKAKLVLDPNCRLSTECMVRTTNGELVVDCAIMTRKLRLTSTEQLPFLEKDVAWEP
jgi:hypothetical protein